MATNRYGHPLPHSNWRHMRRFKVGSMHDGTPPYNGAVAHSMGWPCVPPYQMKARAKARWRAQWMGWLWLTQP